MEAAVTDENRCPPMTDHEFELEMAGLAKDLDQLLGSGRQPQRILTEADVRRIVREELQNKEGD